MRDYGQSDLKEVEQALFQPSHSVSAWFAPEVKLGSLAGSMEVPGCFGAEIYAQVRGGARRGPAHPAWLHLLLGCHAASEAGVGGHRLLEWEAECWLTRPGLQPPVLPVCLCDQPFAFSHFAFLQDLGDEQAPIDLKVNFGKQMLLALFRQWGEQQRAAEQRQQQQAGGAAPASSSGPAAALLGSGGGGGEEESGGAEEAAEQAAGEDNNMPDADGTGEPG